MIYDKLAAGYDNMLAPLEQRFLGEWRRETLSLVPENSRILEIGAGTGANFSFYPDSKCAAASEISSKMLSFAKQKTGDKKIELIQANAENLPFPDNFFDAAFATLVFCSIPQPETAFRELRRVVKLSGKIILLEHLRPGGIAGYAFDLLNVFTVALLEDHFNRRTAEIASNVGLDILEIRKKAFGIVNLIICQNS